MFKLPRIKSKFVTVIIILLLSGFVQATEKPLFVTFYYPSYGTPEIDGEYRGWNSKTDNSQFTQEYAGGDDIASDYYSQLSCYSSNDPDLIDLHMEWIKGAGIDLVAVSWWGAGSFEDKTIPIILEFAQLYDLKICFILETSGKISAGLIRSSIAYIIDNYGTHKSFYRNSENKPLFFINSRAEVLSDKCSSVFQTDGLNTIRGTKYDSEVLGLLTSPKDSVAILKSELDGAFSNLFSSGRVDLLANWVTAYNKVIVPMVSPGLNNSRSGSGNSTNNRDRNNGEYFNQMFLQLLTTPPPMIIVNSFNNWAEGTQIEPAIPARIDSFEYLDYLPRDPDCFLKQTSFWSNKLKNRFSEKNNKRLAKLKNRVMHLGRRAKISYLSPYSPERSASGRRALIDGVIGKSSLELDHWQGFEKSNLDVEFDFGSARQFSQIKIKFLIDSKLSAFAPENLFIEISSDGESYRSYYNKEVVRSDSSVTVGVIKKSKARFIHIVAKNQTVCPAGHPNEGEPAWLFIDEIIID